MIIYIDVLFLINLFMNTFILYVTSKIINVKVRKSNLFFAGLITASVYIFYLYLKVNFIFFGFILDKIVMLCIASFGVLICFNPKKIEYFFKYLIYFHLSAFGVGGVGMALFFYFNVNLLVSNMFIKLNNPSILLLITTVSVSFICMRIVSINIKNNIMKKQLIVNIEVEINDKKQYIKVLVDTGHSLIDKTSNEHVIIVGYNSIKSILPIPINEIYDNNKSEDLTYVIEKFEQACLSHKLRLIPITSIGNASSILVGISVNNLKIYTVDNNELIVKKSILAINTFDLTSDTQLNYNGLINPTLLEELELMEV